MDGKIRIHQLMSRRVSAHFKLPVKIGYDEDEKMFCVINHNNNPVVWFKAFNALAIKGVREHLDLKYHKHNMPKPARAMDETMKARRKKAGDYYDECEEMRKVGSRHSVTL